MEIKTEILQVNFLNHEAQADMLGYILMYRCSVGALYIIPQYRFTKVAASLVMCVFCNYQSDFVPGIKLSLQYV